MQKLETDKPKDDANDDLLGYYPSAELTAEILENIQGSDGIVIGIEGEWGSGKTTYINFVKKALEERLPDTKVIEFKPWLYSGRDDLIAAYFRFLYDSAKDIFGNNKAILKAIGKFAELSSPVLKYGINSFTNGIGGNIYVNFIKKVIPCLQKDTSLETQYNKICEVLAKAKQPLIVIIDDLDRLEADEIRTMLQLVKTVGQLPYVTYILSYDRAYVGTCLDEKLKQTNASYLEKIVQLPIALPTPTPTKLLSMLETKLKPFFDRIEEENYRWETVVSADLFHYINKPRDIVRFLNAIISTYLSLGGEIDIVDLIAMEAFRVFDNPTWIWIRNNKDYLFGEGAFSARSKLAQNEDDFERLSAPIASLSPQQKNILVILFPRLSGLLHHEFVAHGHYARVYWESGSDEKVISRGGIADTTVYDMYFSKFIPPDTVTKSIIYAFLTSDNTTEKMQDELRAWIKK